VIPFTLLIIFVLIYLNTKSAARTAIVLLAVPFSLVGAFWLLYLLHYNLSVAVWVGLIALAGSMPRPASSCSSTSTTPGTSSRRRAA
jgi:Cu(I)/Ag(I) efflux system membrane protein CusA/SilA